MPKFYISTPIYYVNAAPHIGHAYTTIVADTIKRMRRMLGDDAYLTTGSDEHGQKVERSAAAAGLEPQRFTDRISAAFRAEWDELGLECDFFRRTSDPRHALAVRKIFERCLANGAIYKGTYTGKYHLGDEAFVTDEEAAGADPEMITTVTEENYFFRLSAFQDRLLELYESQPEFVQPETRRNEVMAFVRAGLNDLSISRSTLRWGIPLPNDPEHVFYVWFDALTTYMSAIGYGESDGPGSDYDRLWPIDVHLVGKEIVRFHAVYWPAFLMAADLPLPKQVWAHGWLIFQGGKMSKTKGNIVRALPIKRVVGVDGLRYYLLREIVFGQDGNFSHEALTVRYNADLANGIGNLASRTSSMLSRYCGGKIPEAVRGTDSGGLPPLATLCITDAIELYRKFAFSKALETIWSLLARTDKYIVEHKPWELARADDSDSRIQLDATLYNTAEALRIACVLLAPVLPAGAQRIWELLGQSGAVAEQRLDQLRWGGLAPATVVGAQAAVYPRLDVAKSVESMEALEAEALEEQAQLMGGTPAPQAIEIDTPEIEIGEFAKVDMRVGVVRAAERVRKSRKLLELSVDIGEAEPRTILAGIAEKYGPDEMVGRRIAVVANLKPRKMMGQLSQGMLIAATGEDGEPHLADFSAEAPIGARLG
ncbi:MAG: methionine--tRNA ligase [Acidobacteriia bacterium]|nr:methionine--tRNA ligase [Terriglobia bacterium]MYG01836.1 methionine--tRNA ligase [Terriglobia bacterium]MYK10167.1 methionine--tRNA ligase [Terriglobia bacterium]